MVEQEKSSLIANGKFRPVASIYNPDLLTKKQLIGTFVVRLKKFKKLFEEIRTSDMTKPEQPILIVGLRGMGKTTLLLRLSYEVENNESLNSTGKFIKQLCWIDSFMPRLNIRKN